MLLPNPLALLTIGALSAYVANKRGKNPYLWFFLGMLFGIFGLLYLFFSKPVRTQPKRPQTAPNDPNTIDITPKVDPVAKEKFWYYLSPENSRFGPMSFDGLLRAYREGKIDAKTLVWNETLKDWQPLGDFLN